MDEFAKFKVPELKAKCKELGLLVGGTKPVLIVRLQDYYAKNLQTRAGGTVSTSSNDGNDALRPAPQVDVLNTNIIVPFPQWNTLNTNIIAPVPQWDILNANITVPGAGQVSTDIVENRVSGIPTTEDHNYGMPMSQPTNINTPTLSNEHVNFLNTAATGIEASLNIASNPCKKARAKQGDDTPSKSTKRNKKEQPPVSVTQTTSDAPATTAVETELANQNLAPATTTESLCATEANHKPRKRKPTDADGKSKRSKKKKTDNDPTLPVNGGSVGALMTSSGGDDVCELSSVSASIDSRATPGSVALVSATTSIASIAKKCENPNSSEATPGCVNTLSTHKPPSTVPPIVAKMKMTSATAAVSKPSRTTNKENKKPRKIVPLESGVKDIATKNTTAKNTVAKNTAAKNTVTKNTVTKNTVTKNTEIAKRAKINLTIRPATDGGTESVLIAAAPLPNAIDVERSVSNATQSRSRRVGLVGKGRGTKVNLPLKTTPGYEMALPTTPQVVAMRENGGTTPLQNELQKNGSIPTPTIAMATIITHADGAPPKSTRPKLHLQMVKHTPPASIPTLPSFTQAPSPPPPPLTIAALLKTHFIGRFYTSLHVYHPNVSPPPVDNNNRVICGIGACVFDNPDPDAANIAARFWIARFYHVVCNGGWEVAAETEEGRRAGVLAGLKDIVSAENVAGGAWKLTVRERMDRESETSLFVVGCTGEVIGWDEEATSGGRELGGDGRLKADSKDQETWRSLRSDWRDHIERHLFTLSSTFSDVLPLLPLLPLIHPAPHPSFDVTHPRLIHKSLYADPVRLAVAARFVLSNLVLADCFSGPVPKAARKLRFDVPAAQCLYVESAVMPGEIVRNGRGRLAPEIGYVQTTENGFYVLAETGQVIGCEDEGVNAVWRGILECEEFGEVAVEGACSGAWKAEFFGKEIEVA